MFIDTGNIKNTIFIAGSGRSGTTWLMEMINYKNQFRPIFEPFHNKNDSLLKNWKHRQYLSENNVDDKFLIPTLKILKGKIRTNWTDQFHNKKISNKRIIKDIRANLFLKWLHIHHPQIELILLLRHPCAVANSKSRLNWDPHLDEFLSQPDLMNDLLYPFKGIIRDCSDTFEKHILMWCIENYVPLKQFKRNEILVLFYEDLCMNLIASLDDLQSFLRTWIKPKLINQSKPSALVRNDSAINTGSDLINTWKKDISPSQITDAVNICKLFGLDKIYGENSLPLIEGKLALDVIK